jgi:hypothetical protein
MLMPLSADHFRAETIWSDCEDFFNRKGPVDLANVLQERGSQVSPLFFHLIAAQDRGILEDKRLALAAAGYLGNTKVPLDARRQLIHVLRRSSPDAETNAALASALIELAREGQRTNLHPGELGNILAALSMHFVAKKSKNDLPILTPAVRQELLALVHDKKVARDERLLVPLVSWLEEKSIAAIPPPSREDLKKDRRDGGPTTREEKTPAAPEFTKKRPGPPRTMTTPKKDEPSGTREWLVVTAVIAAIAALVGLGLWIFRRRNAA